MAATCCVGHTGRVPGAMRWAEIETRIVGMSVSYGIDASILEIEPKHPVLAPLLFLQKQVVGHWFIDSLGVYRHHRGKGIGRALLENEISRAGQGR